MEKRTIKDLYYKFIHLIYKVFPVREMRTKELFTQKPESSFHIIVAVRNIFFEYSISKEKELLDLYYRCIKTDLKYIDSDVGNFERLICSMKKNGFDREHPIIVDKEKHVIDGTHRLAAAINLNIQKVFIRVIPRSLHPVSAKERLALLRISEEDCQKVLESYERLYQKLYS